MLFSKKKSGTVSLRLREDQFCAVIKENAEDVTADYRILAECENYNLLYRDGEFLGMPAPYGGYIYPFSTDPTKKGSGFDKKKFHSARVVCISKDFNTKVRWGTKLPLTVKDSVAGKAYKVIARGVFYIQLDPNDAARKADKFYNKCLTQREEELFNTEALRDFLGDAFVSHIGAGIQEYIETKRISFEKEAVLTASDVLNISRDLCPKMRDIFSEYGLTVVTETSEGSILEYLKIEPLDGDGEQGGEGDVR